MPRDAVFHASPLDALVARVPAAWRGPLLQLVLAWLGLIAWFWRDWADMAAQWWDSSTYNHILLVPLILGWLAWAKGRALGDSLINSLSTASTGWSGMPEVSSEASA